MSLRVLFVVLAFSLLPARVQGQGADSTFHLGIGAQVGRPSGLSLRWFQGELRSFDLIMSVNINDHLIIHPHYVFSFPIPEVPTRFFTGLGITMGRQLNGPEEGTHFGLSSVAGLNFYVRRVEIYVQALPQVRFLPRQTWKLDGGVGFRYFFRRAGPE